MRHISSILVLILSVVTTQLVGQAPRRPPQTFRVPAEFARVQVAIDSARSGDTILVAPGRYIENLRLRGRNIVLTSEYAKTGDSRSIRETILDGSRPAHPDSGSVIAIYRFEDSTTVVQGFTITGGTGTVWYDNKDKIFFREGGGVLIDLAAPTVRYNIIENNEAIEVGQRISAGGGGIRVGFADPTIEHNIIRNNRGRYGAGVVLFHSGGRFRDNLVTGNVGGQDFGGAGIWVLGHLSWRLPLAIEHNTIVRNRSVVHEPSSDPWPQGGTGGGAFVARAPVAMSNNILWGNWQEGTAQIETPPSWKPVMTASIIEGGFPGVGNTDRAPEFADTLRFTMKPAAAGKVEFGARGLP